MATAPLVYHAVPIKSGDSIHIQRDTSSPQQGPNQQQEDQVSKPLIYPVFELAEKYLIFYLSTIL